MFTFFLLECRQIRSPNFNIKIRTKMIVFESVKDFTIFIGYIFLVGNKSWTLVVIY